jgi:SAGA-associated factor 73
MGAKRSVQGRSKPYDELLLEWNRANNPNFVEPVKRETKQERKERKEREKAEKKKQVIEAAAAAGIDITKKPPGLGPKKGKRAIVVAVPQPQVDDDNENLDDIDSEAEMDSLVQVMRTAQSRGLIGTPLATPCDAGSFFVARRERLRSCRGLYENAFKRGGAIPVPNPTATITGGAAFR